MAVTDGYGHSLYSAAVVNHLVTEYIGLLTDQKTMKETLLQQRIVAIKDKLEFRLEIVDSQQAATSVHNVFKDKTLVAKVSNTRFLAKIPFRNSITLMIIC